MVLLIDLSVKWGALALLALALTRRTTPANAASAHRLWLAVLLTPFLWILGIACLSPAAYARVRSDVLPGLAVELGSAVTSWAIVIYTAGVSLLLGRVAIGVLAVRRFVHRSRPLRCTELAGVRAMAACARMRVLETDTDVPVTAGFFRPVIVLPAGWRSLSRSALTAVLRHEVSHVRRRDCLVALLGALVEALFWFHPAAWLASARVRRTAELAADHAALGPLSRTEYAEELLALAAGWHQARRPRHALMAGAETNVAWRIRSLLDEAERGVRRRPLLSLALGLMMIGTPVSAVVRVGGVKSAVEVPMHGPHGHVHGH